MKKTICIVLLLILSMSYSAYAEEVSLHNGIKLGMSRDEIIYIENENGFALKPIMMTDLDDNGEEIRVETNNLYGKGTVAGQKDTGVSLFFSEDGKELLRVEYRISNLESYPVLNNSLIQKYGVPPYSEENGEYVKFQPHTNGVEAGYCYDTYSNAHYSQWIVPYSDNRSIIITHSVYEMDRLIGSDKVYANFDTHYISYILLTEEETQMYDPRMIIDDL